MSDKLNILTSMIILTKFLLMNLQSKMNVGKHRSNSSYSIEKDNMRKRIISTTILQPQMVSEPVISPVHLHRAQSLTQSEPSKASIDRNIKFQLDQLERRMVQLHADVRSARQQLRELNERTSMLKSTLVYDQLYVIKADLDNKINGVNHLVYSVKACSQERNLEIRSGCNKLWEQTEQLRGILFNLQMKIEVVEQKMGFS